MMACCARLVAAAAVSAGLAAASCAAATGYDPSRYEGAPAEAVTADPETRPLPRSRRTKMLDPRSPLAADAATSEP
jgi:hypothetical protein